MFPNWLNTGVAALLTVGALAVGAETRNAPAEEPTPRLDAQGDPLPDEAVSRLGTTRLRCGGHIANLDFTPDGKTLVSGGADGVRTWDAATGKPLRQFPGDGAGAAPDFPRLMSANRTRDRFALAPDGKWLALLGNDAIRICETETGKEVRSFGGKGMWYCSARFSPDGKRLAALGGYLGQSDKTDPKSAQPGDECFEVWDATTGRRLSSWTISSRNNWWWNGHWQLSSSLLGWADGKTPIVASFRDNKPCILDADTGKLRPGLASSELKLDAGWTALSHDGSLLASVFQDREGDRRVRIWDLATGKERHQFLVEAAKEMDRSGVSWPDFSFVAFAGEDKALVTIGPDGRVGVWDPAAGEEVGRFALKFGPSHYRALVVSQDGKTLALTSDVAIRLFDLKTGKERWPRLGHQENIVATAVTADGRTVATACAEQIVLWDAATGRELDRSEHRFVAPAGRGAVVKTAADGRSLFFLEWGEDWQSQAFRKWELLGGKETRRSEWRPGFTWESHRMDMEVLALAPDGKTAAVKPSNSHSIMILLDGETGKELRRFDLTDEHSQFLGAAFTPDGRTVVAWTCWGNVVRQWDVGTGRPLRPFAMTERDEGGPQNGADAGYEAAVSPNGRYIVFGGNNSLALYDLATGRPLVRSNGLTDGPAAWGLLAFAPDGRSFAWLDSGRRVVHLTETATLRERHRFVAPQGEVTTFTFSADGKTSIAGNSDTTALVWDLTGRLREKETWGKPLAAADLDACWSDLAGGDAAKAYRAVRKLAGSAGDAVAYLKARLHPVPPVEGKRVARLIADLDSDDFDVREDANKELEKMGEVAPSFYRKALEGAPSAEARWRLEGLAKRQADRWRRPTAQRLQTLRALETLESAGTPEARRLLEALAKGAPEADVTNEANASLERLAKRAD